MPVRSVLSSEVPPAQSDDSGYHAGKRVSSDPSERPPADKSSVLPPAAPEEELSVPPAGYEESSDMHTATPADRRRRKAAAGETLHDLHSARQGSHRSPN